MACFGISAALSGTCGIYGWFDGVKAGTAFLQVEHLSRQVYTTMKNCIRLEQDLI